MRGASEPAGLVDPGTARNPPTDAHTRRPLPTATFQKAHYSIDVMVAPFVVYACRRFVETQLHDGDCTQPRRAVPAIAGPTTARRKSTSATRTRRKKSR